MPKKKQLIDLNLPDFSNVHKIHAIETVEDGLTAAGHQTACNTVFYDTELEEVAKRCQSYLNRPGNETAGFVIFKAVAIVRRPQAPVEVITFDGNLLEHVTVDEEDDDE